MHARFLLLVWLIAGTVGVPVFAGVITIDENGKGTYASGIVDPSKLDLIGNGQLAYKLPVNLPEANQGVVTFKDPDGKVEDFLLFTAAYVSFYSGDSLGSKADVGDFADSVAAQFWIPKAKRSVTEGADGSAVYFPGKNDPGYLFLLGSETSYVLKSDEPPKPGGVPEPASLLMWGALALGAGTYVRCRGRQVD